MEHRDEGEENKAGKVKRGTRSERRDVCERKLFVIPERAGKR